MPQFFKLGGQRASAHHGMFGIHRVEAVINDRFAQPIPLHCWISRRMLGIQHMAVLYEEKRLDYERRNAGVARVDTLGPVERIQIVPVAIDNPQSCLIFLAINRIQSEARKGRQQL